MADRTFPVADIPVVVADTDPAAAAVAGTDCDLHVVAEADRTHRTAARLVVGFDRGTQYEPGRKPESAHEPE